MAENMALSDKGIKAAISKGKAALLGDGDNLFLRLRGDAASWIFRFKVPLKAPWATANDFRTVHGEKGERLIGKQVEITLGRYPDLKLGEARDLRRSIKSDLANGIDPRLAFKANPAEAGKTFQTYALEYIATKKGGWRNPKHKQQWENTLATYAYPHIGDKRPTDITIAHIRGLLLPLWASKTETASRLRQRIEAVINMAFVVEGVIDRRNPAAWKGNLEHVLDRPRNFQEVEHHAAAPWQEVPAIMAKLRAKPEVTSALVLRFSILTAARSMEVRAMVWDEVDLDKAEWVLPKSRSKNKSMHKVPLNAEAVQILKAMKARNLKGERVFPGARGGLLSDVAINKVLKAAYPGVTAHGTARSSFRTWVSEATSFPGAVAEAALNHKQKNEVEASYNRTTYLEKRTELMAAWGNFLLGNNNIVELKNAG